MVAQVHAWKAGNWMLVQNSTQRKNGHDEVKKLMSLGQHAKALDMAQKLSREHGPHIGLACDVICCQYQLGLFSACAESIQSVVQDFKSISPRLSLDSSRRTLVFISKIQEELGQVLESLHTLKEAHHFVENKKDQKMILIQELRLMAYLGLKKNIVDHLSVWNSNIEEDDFLDVELKHALLWAEYSLFGFKRVRDLALDLSHKTLSPTDRRLVLRDFLEIAWLSRNEQDSVAQNFFAEFKNRKDQLSFDLFLIDLYKGHADVSHYFYHDDLSIMQKIRMLILRMQTQIDAHEQTDLRKKFHLLTAQLSSGSIKTLSQLLPSELQQVDSKLRLAPQGFSATQVKFMNFFFHQNQVDLSFLSRQLWNEDFNELHYDRIRMLVYKINKLARDQTSFDLFKVTKLGVSLKHKFYFSTSS